AGNLVSPPGRVRLDGQRHQVDGLVVGNRLHAVVVEDAVDVGWREARDDAELERLHPSLVHVEAVLHPPDVGLHEGDSHPSLLPAMLPGHASRGLTPARPVPDLAWRESPGARPSSRTGTPRPGTGSAASRAARTGAAPWSEGH